MADDDSAFEVPSLEEMHELLLAQHANLLPDFDLSQAQDDWKRLRATAGAVTDLHAHIDQAARDAMPDTAEGAAIDRHGGIWDTGRKGASVAKGLAAGRIRGTAGSAWLTTDELVHTNGKRYHPLAAGTIPAAGFFDADVESIDTGATAKLQKGEILRWSTTPAGLEDEVELVADLDQGGEDGEQDGPYQERVLDRIGQPAMGGNVVDYERWAIEATSPAGVEIGVDQAYVYPNRNGLNSVDVAALLPGSGTTRKLSAQQLADLLTYIDARRPSSMALRVLTTTEQTQAVELVVTPINDPQWNKDWDDSTPLVVSTWTPATRALKFTTARPASMRAGHRLVVRGHSGKELVIESLSGTDTVIIQTVHYTPIAAEQVYSGGPLVEPLRAAIQALFDELGPYKGSYGADRWDDTLRLSSLSKVALGQEGVREASTVTPATSKAPDATEYPSDTAVKFLIAGEILVRYA